MPCRATQDEWVMVESSEKMWSAKEGTGKPLQYSYLENTMNSVKRQEYINGINALINELLENCSFLHVRIQ